MKKRYVIGLIASLLIIAVGGYYIHLPTVETHYGISSWITKFESKQHFGIVLDEDNLIFVFMTPGMKFEDVPRVSMVRVGKRTYEVRTKSTTALITVFSEQLEFIVIKQNQAVEIWVLERNNAKTKPIEDKRIII